MLRVRNLNKTYKSSSFEVEALKDVSFSLDKGDFAIIYGPSGCGKTTLINMIAGLDKPCSGEIRFGEKNLCELKDFDMTKIRRRKLGVVFQSYELVKVMTCYDNIAYTLHINRYGKREIRERVQRIAKFLGVEDILSKKPTTISGGQKQRVAIARTLVTDPVLFLGDEITGNLDEKQSEQLYGALRELADKGMTFLLITHDMNLLKHGTKILKLVDGVLTEP